MRYRKKRLVEAVQIPLDPDKQIDAPQWLGEAIATGQIVFRGAGHVRAFTPTGEQAGEPGDWLINGGKGDVYIITDEAFRAVYERAE